MFDRLLELAKLTQCSDPLTEAEAVELNALAHQLAGAFEAQRTELAAIAGALEPVMDDWGDETMALHEIAHKVVESYMGTTGGGA